MEKIGGTWSFGATSKFWKNGTFGKFGRTFVVILRPAFAAIVMPIFVVIVRPTFVVSHIQTHIQDRIKTLLKSY